MRRPSSLLVLVLLLVGALALPASAANGPVYFFDPDAPLGPLDAAGQPQPLSAIEAEEVETVHGDIAGAVYVGQRPVDWNGELVVWAHGYRGEGELLYVDPPPLREWLLDEGYAWIASSYRRNSYDAGIGVLDTKNATQRAAQLWGHPDRTYLAGVSMGGHVTARAIEQFPNLYDGALPACGAMGDVALFDYLLDYNLVAAAFAGLDAAELTYPDDVWVDDEVVDIKQALSNSPGSEWAFSGSALVEGDSFLNETGQAFKGFMEVRSGGERGPIYDVAWDYWHVAGSGNFFFDFAEGDGTIANRSGVVSQNTDSDYASYGDEYAFLNDEVLRVEAANRVRRSRGLQPAPQIQGAPPVPVLSIHTIGDLFVPIEMQQIYAERVAANDRSDLLVQRAIRDVGHCTFSDTEWETTFTDLFGWVETGVAPAGEDLIHGISSPTLGCEWTDSSDGTATARGGIRLFDCRT